jgi:hypothetical protein
MHLCIDLIKPWHYNLYIDIFMLLSAVAESGIIDEKNRKVVELRVVLAAQHKRWHGLGI